MRGSLRVVRGKENPTSEEYLEDKIVISWRKGRGTNDAAPRFERIERKRRRGKALQKN